MTLIRSRTALAPWRALTLVVAALTALPALAQNPVNGRAMSTDEMIRSETFVRPPDPIASAVLAPRHLNVSVNNLSRDRMWFIHEIGDGPVTMDVFSKPFHELGGLFVDFRANRSRNLTIRNNVGLQLVSTTGGNKVSVQLPAGARVSNASWSPDGKAVAFYVHTPEATHIYVSDLNGKATQLTRTPVLATLSTGFDWTANGAQIATVLIPAARAPMPVAPAVPQGPRVKLAEESDKNRLRTYQSLMATPHDQAMLEWHTTGQVALIDVKTRGVKPIGQPTMVRDINPSPDGKYLRVTRMVKPFSYVVPVSNFGSVQEIWDTDGKVLTKVQDTPLNLGVDTARAVTAPGAGGGQEQSGKREVTWRPDGQGLTYLEQDPPPPRSDSARAADDTASQPRRRDRVMHWLPPFDNASAKTLYESNTRIATHRYSPDFTVLFLSERQGQQTHEYAVIVSEPTRRYTLARYRADDVYSNPGTLVMARGTLGGGAGFGGGVGFGGGAPSNREVQVSPDGEHVYLYGTKYDRSPLEVGPKTFLDKVNIKTAAKTRVYESDNSAVFERVMAFHDIEAKRLIVSRESEREVPQAFLRNGDQLTPLTQNTDFTPDLTRAPRESFIVERPDGFKFKVNVTLPPDYQKGTRLPAMFWFYPREFAGQEEYDRGARTYNKNQFPNFNVRSMQFLARLGYAIVEPDAPIVGNPGQQNNNYENDLRNNLSAVIDEVDRRGLVDRTRIGIGGHSYGAFSTVNAMVHTPFFKAGIAGDGNYNRTLTPLDFQSERRSFWDAKDTYLHMSPLLFANNLTGALLLYHGMGDQNVGTELSNSPRLFHALNGLGKTTSLYLYPFEDHGPATKETLLDLWGRWSAWLDKYVKNPPPKKDKTVS